MIANVTHDRDARRDVEAHGRAPLRFVYRPVVRFVYRPVVRRVLPPGCTSVLPPRFNTTRYPSNTNASWFNCRKSTGVTAETPCSGMYTP